MRDQERMMMSDKNVKPWWKQLWPWLIISGPVLAMLACAVTIWLALTRYPDTPLSEGVVKQGLKVEQVAK